MFKKKKKQVSILRLSGVIHNQGRKSLSLQNVKKNIDKAFNSKKNIVVAVVINSPGGSPVQSEMIANYILQKSRDTSTKVITFIEDVAASGGYWLAVTGEEIYALSKSAIVGSLGVLYAGFGLEDFIKRYDIKRRVYTAGKNKVSLDIFQPEKEEDIARLKTMLAEVHTHFKDWVMQRRSNRLKISYDNLFTGEFWVASKGIEIGLIDGIAFSIEDKLKELYGKKIQFNYIENKKGFLRGIFGIKADFNLSQEDFIDTSINKIKEEIAWNKFGI